jgi:starch synthase
MDILFVSPEVAPFVRATSVADVTSALPKALKALGHRPHIFSLLHGGVDPRAFSLARRLNKLSIPLGAETVHADVYEARLVSGVNVTMLSVPGLTDQATVYGGPSDARRYALLSRGAIEWVRQQHTHPSILHAHDWAASLVPLFLSMARAQDPKLHGIRTVLTVHDPESRGLFDRSTLAATGIPERFFSPDELEFYGRVCWLKHGMLRADKVVLPSPTYARELAHPEAGRGLEGVVRHRGADVVGILHGVDFSVFNPATDPHLAARFDAEGTDGREACRADLAERAGLPQRPESPVYADDGPIDAARALDLLAACATRIVRNDARWVLAGDGDPGLVAAFEELAKRFPDRVSFRRTYDEAFLHKAFAGADFWVAPSRREPGAVSHLYAMRYGALPIARAAGAVKDAIVDCDPRFESGTGFLFESADPDELFGAIGRALAAFRRKDILARLRHRVMRRDVSWDRCARQYEALYESVVAKHAAKSAATAAL